MKLSDVIFSLCALIIISFLAPTVIFLSEAQIISVTPNEESLRCDSSDCVDESQIVLISAEPTQLASEVVGRGFFTFSSMPSYDGCSHGFWMQERHFDLWSELSPEQTLESTFDIPNAYRLDTISLHDALNLKGGTSSLAAARLLLKEGTAALLNSAHSELRYPLPMYQVIEDVNNALASESQELMILLAAQLQSYNRNGCPIR
jgi:hypothetical protein